MLPEVELLGFCVSAAGILHIDEKVAAIHEVTSPKNKKELQASLGLLHFYHSFLKGRATVEDPLHRLIDERTSWTWASEATECIRCPEERPLL